MGRALAVAILAGFSLAACSFGRESGADGGIAGDTVASPASGEWSHRLVADARGRIVAVAFSRAPRGVTVTRYLASGSVDDSFDEEAVDVELGAGSLDALAAAVDPTSGAIYVVACAPPECHRTLLVRRVRSDGTFDGHFGATVVPDDPDAMIAPAAVAVQRDGKIVVVAERTADAAPSLLAVRLLPNGATDTSFAVRGAITDQRVGRPGAVAIDGDGRIVVAGDGFVARYRDDGSVDPTFGADGVARVPLLAARDVLVAGDGSVVAAGSGGDRRSPALAIARLQSDGSPVVHFGTRGVVLDERPRDHWGRVEDVVELDDGRLMAAGWATRGGAVPSRRYRAVVLALSAHGLDESFAARGRATFDDVEARGYVLVRAAASLVTVGPDDDLEPRRLVFTRFTRPRP